MPLAPLISVTSITYVDAQTATQTVENTDFTRCSTARRRGPTGLRQGLAAPRSQARAVTIEFTAGYADRRQPSPAPLRHRPAAGRPSLREPRAVVGIDQRGTPMPPRSASPT
jgi:hypothetical protein